MNSNGSYNGIGEYDDNSPYFPDFYQFFNNLSSNGNGKFSDSGCPSKLIMVTSAVEGEGKTTLASYVAMTGAWATEGFHLVVDGDLHRPRLHYTFNVSVRNGLADVLTDTKNLLDVIKEVRKTPHGGLHLITAGQMTDSPLQLLTVEKTKQIFEDLKGYYSTIVVDCPPIIPVSDALRLAQVADGVVLVVRAGKTPREVVRRAIDMLQEAHSHLIGVVLNDVSEVLPYYYRRKYYRYDYQSSRAMAA